MIEHFRRLFSYDDWANREVLKSLRAANDPPAQALELIAHVFSAEYVWLARLTQQTQPFPVWPEFSLAQCEAKADEIPTLWKGYLERLPDTDLASTILHKNTLGESFGSRIDDILTHVIAHGAYHRGQVAQTMRAAGFVPATTDFIHSVRQGFVE